MELEESTFLTSGYRVGLIGAVCLGHSSDGGEQACQTGTVPRSELAGWSVPRSQEGRVDPESELCLSSHGEAPREFPALKLAPGAGLGGSQLGPRHTRCRSSLSCPGFPRGPLLTMSETKGCCRVRTCQDPPARGASVLAV